MVNSVDDIDDTNYNTGSNTNNNNYNNEACYDIKVDTCSNATIIRDISNTYNPSKVNHERYITGIGGSKTAVTHTGYIGNNIPALIVSHASTDLLSVTQCVDNGYHGTFDSEGMKFYDKNNNLVLTTGRDRNGLFACSLSDIQNLLLMTINLTK